MQDILYLYIKHIEDVMDTVKATTADLPAIRELLAQSNLLSDDIEKFLSHCLVIKVQDSIIAVGALEVYVSIALVRSVAVAAAQRKRGLGKLVYHALKDLAMESGVTDLYLLTETAEPFFSKMGFVITSRDDAPESIKNTTQFSSLCPSSATLMKLSI